MTPIPQPVVDLIRGAGHTLIAEPVGNEGGRTMWRWSPSGDSVVRWHVSVGDRPGYLAVRGASTQDSPRTALMLALTELSTLWADSAKRHAATAKRCRYESSREISTNDAARAAKKANDVRALAAAVVALWPEVTP